MKRFIAAIIYWGVWYFITYLIYGYMPGPITTTLSLGLTIWGFSALSSENEKEDK